MIEEIKKEIDKLPLYAKSTPRPTVDYLDVIEILNKYNNQPDYKSAWEELEKGFKNHTEGWLNYEDQSYMCSRFENLKKKYNLGGE